MVSCKIQDTVIFNVCTKFQNSSCNFPEKSLMMILLQRKKEWTNKGNHKQEEADTLIYNTTSNTHLLYRIKKNPTLWLLRNLWQKFNLKEIGEKVNKRARRPWIAHQRLSLWNRNMLRSQYHSQPKEHQENILSMIHDDLTRGPRWP